MSLSSKVDAVWTQPSALKLMEGRERAPKWCDTTELRDGSKLGIFWSNCKRRKKCDGPLATGREGGKGEGEGSHIAGFLIIIT